MWPFKTQTVDYHAKAATMAELLLGVAPEATRIFVESLLGENAPVDKDVPAGNEVSPSSVTRSLLLEVLAFELHLADRLTFSTLGALGRATFMDALCAALAHRLGPPRAAELQDLYNNRQHFYGQFPKLFAEDGESPKGTLLWEFGKLMAAVHAHGNPAAVMATAISGASLLETVNDLLRDAKVTR
jgi:hypothetical protein